MKKPIPAETGSVLLRQKAEAKLKNIVSEEVDFQSESDTLKLVNELCLHQVELEMQNEELQAVFSKMKDATELYDFAPIGYYTLSHEGEILRLNLSGAAILGKERSQLLNSRFAFFISDETKPVFNFFLEKAFKSKTKQSCEITFNNSYSEPIYVHISGIVTGEADNCLVTATDITAYKKSETVVLAASSRLELAMQVADMAWWEMEIATGAVTFGNRKAEMLGYAPEKFTHYTHFTNLLHPDDYDKAMNAMRKHFTGETDKYEVEYRILANTGEYKWFYDIGAINKRDYNGTPLNVTGIVIDISERKKTEAGLEQNRKELELVKISADEVSEFAENIINTIHEPLLALDQDFRVVKANRSFYDFFKVNAGSTIGSLIFDLGNHQWDIPKLRELLETILPLKTTFDNYEVEHDFSTIGKRTMLLNARQIERAFGKDKIILLAIEDITVRKEVQEALSESESRFRRLYESASLGIFQTNADGKVISVNSSFAKMFGYNSPEELKDTVSNVSVELFADSNRRAQIIKLLDKNPELTTFENLYLRKDGSTFTGWLNITRINDHEGRFDYLEGFIEDITQRKLAEDALFKSKEQYEKLAANIPVGVYILHSKADGSFKLDYASTRMAEMLGLSVESLIDNASLVYEIIYPDDRIGFTELNSKGIALGQPFDWTGRVNAGADIKWMHFVSSPELQENGDILWHGLITDITEQKQREQALEESETRFKNLFEFHSAIMLLIDPASGVIIDANEAATRFYGYSKSILQFMTIEEINVLSNHDVLIEREKARINKLNYFVFQHKLASGEDRTVEVHSSPIDFQEKQILFSIIHDITERKLAEDEIQIKNEELLKVNAEKDKFFSIIAHDLRGPIGGFMGLTERMAEGMANMTLDDLQNIARVMKKSASNLYSLLGNLLEWSRMQRGLTTFEPVSFQLLPKIQENMIQAHDSASKKAIAITTSIPDKLEVFADGNMLACIIRNLVANAVKFTPNLGEINISAIPVKGRFVEISISDSGIGMSKELIKNLFDHDVNTSRKGTEGELSSGLGLMICRDFIEKHGGELKVESEEGKGSTFSFSIPAVRF